MKPYAASFSKIELLARAEASAWITRLHGPNRSPEMEQGFQRWLKERPENAVEFESLTDVWDMVAGGVPTRGVPRLERWEHSAEALELKALRQRERQRSRSHLRSWAIAASVLVVVALLMIGGYPYWSDSTYVAAIGEQRTLQLDDGSRVSLNADSSLSVRYDKRTRRLLLERGEALFEVAKDATRPFEVSAGDSRITALGTSFVVRQDSVRTSVTLVEGKVAVASTGGADQIERVVLTAGQRLTLAKKAAPAIDTPPMNSVAAWRRGEVALDDTPLVEAIAEMNRYDKTPIVIESPQIEHLIVSGLYHTGDSEGFVRSVATMYGLSVTEHEDRIELRK